MLKRTVDQPIVDGNVEPGFEHVRRQFVNNFLYRGESGAACTVFHQGRKVVDLWGGVRCHQSGQQWTSQTLSLAFSVTKGMAAAAMAVAHSRGLFELDAPVADYWPEFGCHDKQSITVRQLLSHQAGLVWIDRTLTPDMLADPDRMADLVARQKSLWKPGTRHGYHTLSLGWYQSELIRRLDPKGRSLGEFFRQEIADPLGVEFHIKLPDSVDACQISRTKGFHKLRLLTHLDQLPWKMVLAGIWPRSVVSRSVGFLRMSDPAALAETPYRGLEIPSAGGFGQARAVAQVYDALTRVGGPLKMSQSTLHELVAPVRAPTKGVRDTVLKVDTGYSFGFSRPSPGFQFGVDGGAFGCPGAGGSFGMADPKAEISFAYLTNTMSFRIFDDPRERAVRQAAYQCLGVSRAESKPDSSKSAA